MPKSKKLIIYYCYFLNRRHQFEMWRCSDVLSMANFIVVDIFAVVYTNVHRWSVSHHLYTYTNAHTSIVDCTSLFLFFSSSSVHFLLLLLFFFALSIRFWLCVVFLLYIFFFIRRLVCLELKTFYSITQLSRLYVLFQ